MANKNQASFMEYAGVIDADFGIRATLIGVYGHPRSPAGARFVTTSRVERIGYGDDGSVIKVETKNTVYRRLAS